MALSQPSGRSITENASPTVAGRYLHPAVEDMATAMKKFPRYPI
jgi:hypothetical protein